MVEELQSIENRNLPFSETGKREPLNPVLWTLFYVCFKYWVQVHNLTLVSSPRTTMALRLLLCCSELNLSATAARLRHLAVQVCYQEGLEPDRPAFVSSFHYNNGSATEKNQANQPDKSPYSLPDSSAVSCTSNRVLHLRYIKHNSMSAEDLRYLERAHVTYLCWQH